MFARLWRLIISMLMVIFGVLFCAIKLPEYEKLNHPPYNVAQLAQWTYWTLLNIYTLTFMVDFTKIRVSWNIRTSSYVHHLSSADRTVSDEYSHELYSGDSDTSSRNHVFVKRNSSFNVKGELCIPRELTTKV